MPITVTVRDLMNASPLTVDQFQTVGRATRTLLEQAASEAYVVDDEDRLLGVVTDYELLKSNLLRSDRMQPVNRIMSRSMMILSPDMRLEEVAGLFRESCYDRIPVLEQGRLAGQLTRRDVLRAIVVLNELTEDEEMMMTETISEIPSSFRRRIEAAEAEMPPRPMGRETSGSPVRIRKSMFETR